MLLTGYAAISKGFGVTKGVTKAMQAHIKFVQTYQMLKKLVTAPGALSRNGYMLGHFLMWACMALGTPKTLPVAAHSVSTTERCVYTVQVC